MSMSKLMIQSLSLIMEPVSKATPELHRGQQSLSMISMSVALLVATSIEFRGRVMGLRMLAVYGLPLGLVAGGALVERIGFTPQATLYALLGLAATTAITYHWRAVLWHRQ